MKKYLMLPILAAFAATPALAQQTESPYPNKEPAGTGSEARDDNVVKGAKESQDSTGGAAMGTSGDLTQPNKTATGSEGREDNVVKGAKESSEPGMDAGRAQTDAPPPNKANTGSEGKDENRLPNPPAQ